MDTGAQCNVLPVDTYKKATGDKTLSDVTPTSTQVTAYGGATLPVVGSVLLRVWREESKYRLECKLVDSRKIRPLLGRKACLGMMVIQYLDNDAIRKPDTANAPVYALEPAGPISIEQLKKEHPEVFGPRVGLLEGKYRIALDESVYPVQHPPRRVQVPLRAALKDALDEQDILAPVQQPTPWVSSMAMVVPKKDGKPRICLDPRDLNKAIRREHYPLPTIEDILTHLHGAKVFTVLDVSKGFWHVELEEDSSFLTTFNTQSQVCKQQQTASSNKTCKLSISDLVHWDTTSLAFVSYMFITTKQ